MDHWSEIRTAYKLAKFKTLSATAKDMGVHRSTVMRHIDLLEEKLQAVLFQRNDKGYIPTEKGIELMHLAQLTENQFNQFSQKMRNKEQELTGELIITCISEISAILMPIIELYQNQNPNMRVKILGDIRNYNLEYGEADIAIRAGPKPQTLDNIVKPLLSLPLCLCAHKKYIEQHGMPVIQNLFEHKYIALNERPDHLYWNEWIYENVDEKNIVFKGSDSRILYQALINGVGLGYASLDMINNNSDLVKVETFENWSIDIWTLVHRDMIKMEKIKAFVELLNQAEFLKVDNNF